MKKILKAMLCLLMIFTIFSGTTVSIKADELDPALLPESYETDMETYFPDQYFRAAVKKAVNTFYTESGKAVPATTIDILKGIDSQYGDIARISVGSKLNPCQVASIKGIEYLPNAEIVIHSDKLEDISYAFSDKTRPIGGLSLNAPIHIFPTYDEGVLLQEKTNFYWTTMASNSSFKQQYGQKGKVVYLYDNDESNRKIKIDTQIMAGDAYILDKRTNDVEQAYITQNELTGNENVSLEANRYVVIDKVNKAGRFMSGFNFHYNLLAQDVGEGGSPNRYSFQYHYIIEDEFYYSVKLNKTDALGLDTLEFTKTDSLNNPIKGAKFEIYTDEAMTQLAKQYSVAEGAMVDVPEVGTDDNGVVKVENLSPGTYYIKETVTPYGYEAPANPVASVTLAPLDISMVEQSISGGEGTTITINKDVTNFVPTWDYNCSTYGDMEIKGPSNPSIMTTEDYEDVKAEDVGVDFFVKNGGNAIAYTDSLEGTTAIIPAVYEIWNEGAKGTQDGQPLVVVNSLNDAVSFVNGLINDGELTDNIIIDQKSGASYANEESMAEDLTVENVESDVDFVLQFKKVFKKSELNGEDFSFALYNGYNAQNEPIEVVKNDADGQVIFQEMSFNYDPESVLNNTHTFSVRELLPAQPNKKVVYDTDVRNIKVVIIKGTAACNFRLQAQIYLNDNLFATVDAADELPNIYADTITNSLIIDVPIPNTAVK